MSAVFALVAVGCGGPRPAATAPEPAGSAAASGPLPSAGPASSAAVEPSAPVNAELPQRVALLGGRLAVHVPAGARVAPRPHGIMSADASDEDETRVLIVPGQGEESLARFVLLAHEAFVLGSGDAPADAEKLIGESSSEFRLEPLTAPKGLAVVSYAPKTEPKGSPLFVLGAMVERADHSLVQLNFYILNEMAAERASYEARALAIVKTLELGKGELPGGKKLRLDPGGGPALVLDLPRAAVMTRQNGPDFLVFHVREIGPVGERSAEIGVYVGGHPSPQYKQADVPAKRVKKSAGTLLGRHTDWYTWEPEAGQVVSEAIGSLGKHEMVHVFVSGPATRVTELRKAAQAMRAEKKGP